MKTFIYYNNQKGWKAEKIVEICAENITEADEMLKNDFGIVATKTPMISCEIRENWINKKTFLTLPLFYTILKVWTTHLFWIWLAREKNKNNRLDFQIWLNGELETPEVLNIPVSFAEFTLRENHNAANAKREKIK